jgi:hypothetical protein
MSGKIAVQRYWQDTGKRENATLPLEWHPSSQRDLLNALHSINAAISRGLSLKEAVRLTFDVSQAPSAKVNWKEVLDRFRLFKVESGAVKETTWLKEYEPRLQWFVDQLNDPAGGNDGAKALEAMRVARNGQGDQPGSRGRKLRIQYAAQMLRFAVEEVGLDPRWLPPNQIRLAAIIGRREGNAPVQANSGQAHALTEAQFLKLYDSISNPSWKLAIGLIGTFGLRGVELNYCTAQEHGLQVDYEKRTLKGKTKPRLVPILDPQGRPGLGRQLMLTLGSGMVELPPLGREDADASGEISTFLRRNAVRLAVKGFASTKIVGLEFSRIA